VQAGHHLPSPAVRQQPAARCRLRHGRVRPGQAGAL